MLHLFINLFDWEFYHMHSSWGSFEMDVVIRKVSETEAAENLRKAKESIDPKDSVTGCRIKRFLKAIL